MELRTEMITSSSINKLLCSSMFRVSVPSGKGYWTYVNIGWMFPDLGDSYAQYTPPTQLNSTAELRRRRRCVLGFRLLLGQRLQIAAPRTLFYQQR